MNNHDFSWEGRRGSLQKPKTDAVALWPDSFDPVELWLKGTFARNPVLATTVQRRHMCVG